MAVLSAQQAGAAHMITHTEIFGFNPNNNVDLTFDKFDGSLGELLGVEVIVEYTKTGGSLAVDNDAATPGVITLEHSVRASLSVTSGGVLLLDNSPAPRNIGGLGAINAVSREEGVSIGATTGDPTNAFNDTGLEDFHLFEPGPVTVSDSGTINPFFQNAYVATPGSDTFTLNFDAFQTTDATGTGTLQQAIVVSGVEGFVTVIYHYEAIPEPSSMLLGLGAFGLFLRRRR